MSETWEKIWCPECKEVNWYCLGNLSDLTVSDFEAFQCRSCKHRWFTFEDESDVACHFGCEEHEIDDILKGDDILVEVGRENPS